MAEPQCLILHIGPGGLKCIQLLVVAISDRSSTYLQLQNNCNQAAFGPELLSGLCLKVNPSGQRYNTCAYDKYVHVDEGPSSALRPVL